MMNIIIRLFFCVMALGLLSCSTHHNTHLNSASVNQCKSMCIQRFDVCNKSCVDNCKNCTLSAYYRSSANFTKYSQEIKVMGGIVSRELNSYRDPLKCRKISCNCEADRDTCTQGCTGVIQKRLKIVHNCT